jgi:LuxR family transcriptional regulator, maltose regulon positive regulatory protein
VPTSILATKLYIPPPRPNVVLRPRLIEQLSKGHSTGSKLTLIAAPAGFGKTTLISEWIASCGRPTAWLSLDEGDSDPVRFLTYLIAAMWTIAPNIGAEVLSTLQSLQVPPTEAMLTALLNEIAAFPDNFNLVLDDYHLIDSKPSAAQTVNDALTFLVEHQPPRMHLIITTREDPNLPLARLRVRNQLTELRVADLRFTPTEAAEFLNRAMGLSLSAEDIAALEARTEGWIAGLQLAALSMQSHQDVDGFIQSFAGDHRYVVDYLVEEVLKRQPEPIRNFLLQTAILDRLTGSLCEAVTGQSGGDARLETLQRGNFFLIPLDDQRHWYRYHHLFADVLRMHLQAEQPDHVPALHRCASEWYEQNGSPADAIRHALAGKDFDRAANLIELAAPAMRRSRQEATLLGWLKALPDDLFRTRPVLNAEYVGALLSNGQMAGLEDRLREAERWLDTPTDSPARPDETLNRMIVLNQSEFRRLPGSIAMYRAALALARGNTSDTVTHARQVLDFATDDDHLLRGAAAAILGLAAWTIGNLEDAHRSYADGMAHLLCAGNVADAIGGQIVLADIRIAQGRLREARRTYERGLQLAREHGTPTLRGTADMYVGLSNLEREHNNLQAATQHLLKSKEQGEHTGFPQHPYRWRVAMAHIRQVEGDFEGALDLLAEAERLYMSDFSPNVRPIAAWRTRVWLAQGRLAEALGWARERGLSAEDDLSYLREFEHITLARVLMRDHTDSAICETLGLLERLLQATQAGGRLSNVLEILVLQALAHQLQGDSPAALVSLERALTLAEPEGYVRLFLDEGAPMAQLLRDAAARRVRPDYTSKLLAGFDVEQPQNVGESPQPDRPVAATPAAHQLIEPLSQRELEVLRLFATELSGPEIARELVIGLSTVRTHTKSIYSKLSVTNRRAAVQRAIELDLI